MDDTERILLAGDWHGFTPHAEWVLERAQQLGITRVFQCGDFGMWEHDHSGVEYLDDLQKLTERTGVRIYCLGGNHDNEKLAFQLHGADLDDEGFVKLREDVRLAVRGHHWNWHGVDFLALGGAYSVDKHWRVDRERMLTALSRVKHDRYGARFEDHAGTLWFPDEELTDANVATAIGTGDPVDVMLTHDKPLRAQPAWNRKDFPECAPNQEKIQRVVDDLLPRVLVHGHLHYPYRDTVRNGDHETHVVGLDADAKAQEFERDYDRKNSVAILSMDYAGAKMWIKLGDGDPVAV